MFLTGDAPVVLRHYRERGAKWLVLHDTIFTAMLRHGKPVEEFCKLFGHSVAEAKARAVELTRKTGSSRRWTESEKAFLKENFASMSTVDLVIKLCRSRETIQKMAFKLGVAGEKSPRVSPDVQRKILEYYEKGYSDQSISELTGIYRRTVGHIRRKHGLKSNGLDEIGRQKIRESNARTASRYGCDRFADVPRKIRQAEIDKLGWPGVSMSAALCANYLWEKGPATREMIAKALGRSKAKHALCSDRKGGTITAELIRKGYVIELPAAVKSPKGDWVSLYMIPIGVEPLKAKS